MRKSFVASLMAVVLIAAFAATSLACTSIPVSKGASAGGYVMTTWTDDSGSDNTRINVVPAKDWPAGSTRVVLRNTDYGQFEQIATPIFSPGVIPQVEHTYQYINASYSFMNENGVGMGETTIGGTSKMRNTKGWFDIVELQRVALERSKTAREAVLIMGDLAEKYGYGIGGECLTVVDKDEVWLFEVFGPGPLWEPGSSEPGAVWAAVRIPEGYVGVSANRSRIGEVYPADTANYLCSKHIFSLATELGLWDPASGKPFKVFETYGLKAYSPYNARREWRVFSLLAPSLNLDPWSERYPFAIKPDKPVTPQMLMAICRDHYEGTEFDLTKGLEAGAYGTPDRWPTPSSNNPKNSAGWERAISMFRTNFSVVFQMRGNMPAAIGGLVWFGYDKPGTTCYIPIYAGAKSLPKSFETGNRGANYDVFSRESAWWAFNFVSNYANLKYSEMIKEIKATYEPMEAEFFKLQPYIEKAATDLYAKDPELAKEFITQYTNSAANKVVDAWWKLASTLAARYTDGYTYGYTDGKLTQTGYPKEWLDAVGFGISTIRPELRTSN